MKILFIFLIILPLSTIAAEPSLPREKAEAFLASLQKGEVSVGFDRLFIGSGMKEAKPQTLDALKLQTQNGLLSIYGKILGYEFIKDEKYGASLVRLVYVLKSEKFLTIWEFHFYKPKESWFTANVAFTDQFDILR